MPGPAPEEVAEPKVATAAEAEVETLGQPSADELLVRKVALQPLREGARLTGYVEAVDDAKKAATVNLIGRSALVPFSSLGWARPRKDNKLGAAPTKVSEVLAPGDLVRVRVVSIGKGSRTPTR